MSPALAGLLVALSCAAPRVEVADDAACPDPAALSRALTEAGVDAPLLVQLTPAAAPGALDLRVTVADVVIIQRTLAVAPADCPHVPRLVAGIVRRRLDELPRETWDPPPPRPPPPPPSAWRWSGAAALGASLAPADPSPRWLLAAGLSARRARLALDARLAAHLRPAIALGAGDATLSGLALEAGAGLTLGDDALALTPLARLAAGAQLAWGSGYPTDATALLPVLDALAGLRLSTRALFAELLARVPLARARLLAPADAAATEPPARFELTLGLTF